MGLPNPRAIITYCYEREKVEEAKIRAAHPNGGTPPLITGFPLEVDRAIIGWIKFGPTVNMAEAYTQEWAREARTSQPNVRVPMIYMAFTDGHAGYIAMEYIKGSHCDMSDVRRVAAALLSLLNIRASSRAYRPGPIEGISPVTGLVHRDVIKHPFFQPAARTEM